MKNSYYENQFKPLIACLTNGIPDDYHLLVIIPYDALVIAQWLYNHLGEKEYNEKLRDILKHSKKPKPNAIHRQILRLNPHQIVTTNFDNLLEKALEEEPQELARSSYNVIRRDKDLPYAPTSH